jgi:hypothetical protein
MNLGRFLEQYRAKMAADFIVLTDTNYGYLCLPGVERRSAPR